MDWQTAYELVVLDTHRAQNPVDRSRAQVALSNAMRRYQETPFHFSEVAGFFRINRGVQSYGFGGPESTGSGSQTGVQTTTVDPASLDDKIPSDLASPLLVYIQTTGITWTPIDVVTHDEVRWYTYNNQTLGYPSIYSWFSEAMHFYSIPNDDYAVRVDYMRKISSPQVIFEGSDFRVVIQDPQDPEQIINVPDDYTNDFLSDATDLITARARWEIYTQHHDDQENAQKEGAVIEDALSRLRRKMDGRNAELRIRPMEV